MGRPVYLGSLVAYGGGNDGEPIWIVFHATPGQPEAPLGEVAQPLRWNDATSSQSWQPNLLARGEAAQRKGAWEIARGPVLANPAAFPTPVEKILACWAQGARDPSAMWHCSGQYVTHGEFAACMAGAWCVPPTVVPDEIRATGLPLAPYATVATAPIPHLAKARADAAACLLPGTTQIAFERCFLPRQMPLPDLLAMTCAKTRQVAGLAADAEWVKMCVAAASGVSLQLPPLVQACVTDQAAAHEALAACLTALPELQSNDCRQMREGRPELWINCLYEQASQLAVGDGDLKCLVHRVADQTDPLACLRDGMRIPDSPIIEMWMCTYQQAPEAVQACLARVLLSDDVVRGCVDDSAEDLARCAVAGSGNARAIAVADCLRKPESEQARCIAAVALSDEPVAQALLPCTDAVAGVPTVDARCVANRLFVDAAPAARCMAADDVPQCLSDAMLGPGGRSVLRCIDEPDPDRLEACLAAAGIRVSPELDAAWACRNTRDPEDALHCLAGRFLGEEERKVLECARSADTPEAAALCMASTRLGERERALLECLQASDDAVSRLACALAIDVLGAEDRRTLACAMRGGVVDFVLCKSLKDLTPEQQAAVGCAVESFGEPASFAACMGAKLTLMELTKCLAIGVGTEGGCFGESNDLRRAVETAYKDLTHGPGANNDLVQLAGHFGAALAELGGPVGEVLEGVLQYRDGAPVLIGPTLTTAIDTGRQVLKQAGQLLGNLCNCDIDFGF